MGISLAVSYWLGAGNVFGMEEAENPVFSTLLFLPAGLCLFISCAMYAYCWGVDNWSLVKTSTFYRAVLAGISLVAAMIVIAMLMIKPG